MNGNINVKYNNTLNKNILINNNPIIFNNNTNKLYINAASNYNKSDFNLFEINPNITEQTFIINIYLNIYM